MPSLPPNSLKTALGALDGRRHTDYCRKAGGMVQGVIDSVDDRLHARSASRFAQLAGDQPAIVFISTAESEPVETTSILAVMNLGIAVGDEIILSASGDEAASAIATLADFLTSR